MTNGDCFSPPIIFVKTLCRTPLSQTIDSQLGEKKKPEGSTNYFQLRALVPLTKGTSETNAKEKKSGEVK